MWACVLLFSCIGMLSYAKPVSMDICADEWLLEHYSLDEIGGVTWLVENPRMSTEAHRVHALPKHHGDMEALLALRPTQIISEYPLGERLKRLLQKYKIPIAILPPLKRFKDVYQRFPHAKPLSLPSIGQGKTVLILTQNLHSPGRETLWDDLLSQLKFKNATTDLGITGWGYVSAEQILMVKPALLIVLGETISLPKCLNHIPMKYIPTAQYLCPSPKKLAYIIQALS